MSAPRIILASLLSYCQNYQNCWKFDKVLTKTILYSYSRHGVVNRTLSTIYINLRFTYHKFTIYLCDK